MMVPTDTLPGWLQAWVQDQPGVRRDGRRPRPDDRRPGRRAGRSDAALVGGRSSRCSRRWRSAPTAAGREVAHRGPGRRTRARRPGSSARPSGVRGVVTRRRPAVARSVSVEPLRVAVGQVGRAAQRVGGAERLAPHAPASPSVARRARPRWPSRSARPPACPCRSIAALDRRRRSAPAPRHNAASAIARCASNAAQQAAELRRDQRRQRPADRHASSVALAARCRARPRGGRCRRAPSPRTPQCGRRRPRATDSAKNRLQVGPRPLDVAAWARQRWPARSAGTPMSSRASARGSAGRLLERRDGAGRGRPRLESASASEPSVMPRPHRSPTVRWISAAAVRSRSMPSASPSFSSMLAAQGAAAGHGSTGRGAGRPLSTAASRTLGVVGEHGRATARCSAQERMRPGRRRLDQRPQVVDGLGQPGQVAGEDHGSAGGWRSRSPGAQPVPAHGPPAPGRARPPPARGRRGWPNGIVSAAASRIAVSASPVVGRRSAARRSCCPVRRRARRSQRSWSRRAQVRLRRSRRRRRK